MMNTAASPAIRVGGYQLMPDMTPEEFAALKADIAERGVVTPIDVDDSVYCSPKCRQWAYRRPDREPGASWRP